jgi:hypothetical protein
MMNKYMTDATLCGGNFTLLQIMPSQPMVDKIWELAACAAITMATRLLFEIGKELKRRYKIKQDEDDEK